MTLEPLNQARARVRDAVERLGSTSVKIDDALGLVLAQEVVAAESIPPFDNTAMDGYAVRAADTVGADESAVCLRVVGELPAGAAPSVAVAAGEAIRIMTGAPIPPGADAIVPVEATSQRDGGELVAIHSAAEPAAHVRRAGGDVAPGETVFDEGTELGPAHLGVLASLGLPDVEVTRRPRVAVMSTGDELVEQGPLAPGQIRDSNRPLLRALVREAGCEVVDFGICPDVEAEVRSRLTAAVSECDALVTSGGVSVGDYDFVKLVLSQLAAERGGGYQWSQIAIRPAKPLAFGTVGAVPVFGLPGNPVSSHVSFELFARPALRKMAGHRVLDRPVVAARAGEVFGRRRDGKLHLDRVRVVGGPDGYTAVRSGAQASNVLSGMASANGLAFVPDGTGIAAGERVDVMLLAVPDPG